MRALPALLLSLSALACGGPRPSPPPERPSPSPLPGYVSLAPSLTENLFELGLGERLVGVTEADDWPPQVARLPRVAGLEPNLEAILGLGPERVLVDAALTGAEPLARMRGLGLRLLVLEARSLADLDRNLEALGRALGAEPRAAEVRARLARALEGIDRAARAMPRPPRVFVEICPEPLITAGPGGLVHELIERAGGQNLYRDLDQAYPTVSLEDLIRRDPDLLLLTVSDPVQLRSRPGWQRLRALQAGRARRIDPGPLSRPTTRVIEALQELQRFFLETRQAQPGSQ